MTNPADVVEKINELAAEEKCPHCERAWHQLPLTRQVARMFDAGRFDADYFSREDTSPILCDGSTFIGPLRPKPNYDGSYASGGVVIAPSMGLSPPWIASLIDATVSYVQSIKVKAWLPGDNVSQWATLTVSSPDPGFAYYPEWNLGVKSSDPWVIWKEPEPVCSGPVPDVDVEFGPQNWLPVTEHVYVPPETQSAVLNRWQHFTKPEPTPVPASPGYDFTAFQGDEPKYPTSKKGKRHEGI